MLSYEEAHWSKLSPKFREAHNRHRVAKGLPAFPPPVKDEYVPPMPRKVLPVVISEADAMAEYRAQTGAFDAMLSRMGKGEGFTVKDPGDLGMGAGPTQSRPQPSEGFTIR